MCLWRLVETLIHSTVHCFKPHAHTLHALLHQAASCQIINESVEGVMSMLDAPLAQNFPEFLEILVFLCPPEQKTSDKSKSGNSQTGYMFDPY